MSRATNQHPSSTLSKSKTLTVDKDGYMNNVPPMKEYVYTGAGNVTVTNISDEQFGILHVDSSLASGDLTIAFTEEDMYNYEARSLYVIVGPTTTTNDVIITIPAAAGYLFTSSNFAAANGTSTLTVVAGADFAGTLVFSRNTVAII